jgi:tetratricopeptide (TPR) repeat protein
MPRVRLPLLPVVAALALAGGVRGQLVPDAVAPAESVARAVGAEWLEEEERKDLRVLHGLFDARDLDTPRRRAAAARSAWILDEPAFDDPTVPAAWRAERALRRGRFQEALSILGDATDPESVAIRAESLAWLGRVEEALEAARSLEHLLEDGATARVDEVVAAARAALVRGRLERRSAAQWQRVVDALGRSRNAIDRMHWPALLVEGLLLADKRHEELAVPAIGSALSLQPRAAEAWFALGMLAGERFDFDGAERAARALTRLDPDHPLAAIVRANAALVRRDPDLAADLIDRVLEREPTLPDALVLRAAADAVRYDFDAARARLAEFDRIAPGDAYGHLVVGGHLSDNRQYEIAAEFLEEAIRRRPNWGAPRIRLGMLETQTGRDEKARRVLTEAVEVDPFDRRARFSLFLLDELAGYARIESDHFIIRYKPGIDEVVAASMPAALDAMHRVVSDRFGHEPATKTIIDLMPDHPSFAVRITGMPQIHTIAAATGPVIAIEVPRVGSPRKHLGTFDWLKVLRHEYTHTVNLSQTRNRVPHWLTEAAAVSMEFAPRDYATCQMLARELEAGTLFDLETINWGFIRPRRPHDRALAYAQGYWMVEFMNERFGASALPRLLDEYSDGTPEDEAMRRVLGVSREEFHRAFLTWAADEVRAWGLAAEPSMESLLDEARVADPAAQAAYAKANRAALEATAARLADQIGLPGDPDRDAMVGREWPRPRAGGGALSESLLAEWLERYPEHPDVLELAVRRRIARSAGAEPDEETLALLDRYARARPVDPFPHRRLARRWLDRDQPRLAIPHLEALDAREEKDNGFALELARAWRKEGDPARASAAVERAARMNPYDPAVRELAASIAVEAGDLASARRHIAALLLLEPDRPQHRRRLERIDELIRVGD